MLVEFLYHFFSMDLGWIIDFTLGNLLWLFIFAACAFYMFEKRNWFWSTVFIVFLCWIYIDFSNVIGWKILTKEFWMINFLVMMGVLMFSETDSWGKDNLVLVNTIRSLAVIAFYNLFLV
ncbi:MAG: hypothetical protein V1777_04870 [Candidatus Micrarchaeota archaeon]